MIVLEFEKGMPKQIMLSGSQVEAVLLHALNKGIPQYGNLMPIEKLQVDEVLGKKVYVVTLESEDDRQ